jgi:hypothetical protein
VSREERLDGRLLAPGPDAMVVDEGVAVEVGVEKAAVAPVEVLSREVRLDARLLVPVPDAMVVVEVVAVEVAVEVLTELVPFTVLDVVLGGERLVTTGATAEGEA